MNCTACGAPLLENAKFCNKCGQPIQVTTAGAGQPVGPDACPTCGATLLPAAKFCDKCGAAVGGPPAAEAPKPAPKPRARWGRVALGLALAAGALAVAVFVLTGGEPTYAKAVQESLEEAVALRDAGDAALSSGDTQAIREVADQLHAQYQRLNRLTPPPDYVEYHTSVMEWAFLLYQASEQIVAQDLKAAGDAAVAAGDYEALLRMSAELEIRHQRLSDLSPPPKFEGYHSSVIDWVVQTSRAAQQIVSASMSPEQGQIVWGTTPVMPALTDIPIDGGLFASIEPQVGPQPGQVFYNIPPNSSLWNAITRLKPSCRIYPCYEVPQFNPPQPGEVLPFIVGEGGQPIGGTGITQGEEPPPEPPWFQAAVNNCDAIGGRVERSAGSYAFSCYYGTALATQCIFNVDEAGTFYPDPDPRCEPGVQPPPPDLPPGLPPDLLASGGDLEAFADACRQVNAIYPGLSTSLSGSSASGYTCVITASVEDFSYSCSITLYPSGNYDYSCQ